MRKTALILLLALVSGSAAGEWVLAGGNEIATAYFDPATVSKAGATAKMWNLFDLKTARLLENQSYMSMKRHVEYDCKDARTRLLFFSGHSGNMAGGTIVFSDSDTREWEPVAPESGNETLWKIACGKK